MALINLKADLGIYENRQKWMHLRRVYEARTKNNFIQIFQSVLDKKILAQMPKGFMATNGTIMIGINRRKTMDSAYLPNVLGVTSAGKAHDYDVIYTERKPRKVTTLAWLKHIGKELGYEVIAG